MRKSLTTHNAKVYVSVFEEQLVHRRPDERKSQKWPKVPVLVLNASA